MRRKLITLAVVGLLAAGLPATVASGATRTPLDCPGVVEVPGGWRLTQDVSGCGFDWTQDDTTIDLGGHTYTGALSPFGDGQTVRNGTVVFEYDWWASASDFTVSHVTVQSSPTSTCTDFCIEAGEMTIEHSDVPRLPRHRARLLLRVVRHHDPPLRLHRERHRHQHPGRQRPHHREQLVRRQRHRRQPLDRGRLRGERHHDRAQPLPREPNRRLRCPPTSRDPEANRDPVGHHRAHNLFAGNDGIRPARSHGRLLSRTGSSCDLAADNVDRPEPLLVQRVRTDRSTSLSATTA